MTRPGKGDSRKLGSGPSSWPLRLFSWAWPATWLDPVPFLLFVFLSFLKPCIITAFKGVLDFDRVYEISAWTWFDSQCLFHGISCAERATESYISRTVRSMYGLSTSCTIVYLGSIEREREAHDHLIWTGVSSSCSSSPFSSPLHLTFSNFYTYTCLLYTSDAADEMD